MMFVQVMVCATTPISEMPPAPAALVGLVLPAMFPVDATSGMAVAITQSAPPFPTQTSATSAFAKATTQICVNDAKMELKAETAKVCVFTVTQLEKNVRASRFGVDLRVIFLAQSMMSTEQSVVVVVSACGETSSLENANATRTGMGQTAQVSVSLVCVEVNSV
jgi:hypothetical protein